MQPAAAIKPTVPLGTDLYRFCLDLVEERILAVGIQLSILTPSEHIQVCVGIGGSGRPLHPQRRMRVYCAGKPLTALAVLEILTSCGASIDDAVGDLDPEAPLNVRAFTVRDLLQHSTPFVRPRALDVVGLSSLAAMRSAIGLAVKHSPSGSGYSEVAAWFILSDIVSRLTVDSFGAWIRRWFDSKLQLPSTSFGGDSESDINVPVESNAGMSGTGTYVPFLSDTSPRHRAYLNPAFGGFSTAEDLASFYHLLLRSQADGLSDLTHNVQSMVTKLGPMRPDLRLGGRCRFGLGIMADLEAFHFGKSPSADAYGHSGFVGNAFGFVDFSAQLAIGCLLVGVSDADSAIRYLRPALIDQIYGLMQS